MFQKIVLFSGLFFLASCQSEVCECADQWLEMTNALKAAEAKGESIDKLLKKYEEPLNKCENMDANKTAAEKEQMLEELRSCESYKKIGKE
ncbi:MAG: hypothetical protein NWS92_07475 [Crocinitomicaceae bacterium]|jgi:hypothetical protein|nr:hypothetical protein [Crocinitomicaceae bacterium]MDP4723117.1 hypothetical protein [Crocinitomicaceae bacterium]MDP4739725.1 hypothetical protein [Crocinitomicaceae bacterium]MDP4799470.1 hypothetical protein [Crocinitomicaceae bacterium]MDP4806284.1 hypothetical protein [Crocinitomicaceae bacterium]